MSFTHQQISNHICIESGLWQRYTPTEDYWVYRRWWLQIWHADWLQGVVCVARCVCHSAVVATFCEDLLYFEITRITTLTKWLKRLALVVLIWVEKESSNYKKWQLRMHCNLRQPNAAQSLSALISSPVPSLKSLSLSVAVLERFYCCYVTLCCDLELWPRDLDLWPLTLNICGEPAMP